MAVSLIGVMSLQLFNSMPRKIHALPCSVVKCMSYSIKDYVRMNKIMKKMINKGPKKKQWYSNPMPSRQTFLGGVRKASDSQHRRAKQVGIVLYDYITEHINSGELDAKLCSMALDIIKVQIPPDFSAINVYWAAEGTERDDETQNLLNENCWKLRHMLTSYRVIGRIPPINFVKDITKARYKQVVELLKKVDFGPDFQPTQHNYVNSIEPSLEGNLGKVQKKLLTDTEHIEMNCLGESYSTDISANEENGMAKSGRMLDTDYTDTKKQNHFEDACRQDIYGLDHASLMKKVLVSKQPSQIYSAKDSESSLSSEQVVSELSVQDYSKMIEKNKIFKMKTGKIDFSYKDYVKHHGELTIDSLEADNKNQYHAKKDYEIEDEQSEESFQCDYNNSDDEKNRK